MTGSYKAIHFGSTALTNKIHETHEHNLKRFLAANRL